MGVLTEDRATQNYCSFLVCKTIQAHRGVPMSLTVPSALWPAPIHSRQSGMRPGSDFPSHGCSARPRCSPGHFCGALRQRAEQTHPLFGKYYYLGFTEREIPRGEVTCFPTTQWESAGLSRGPRQPRGAADGSSWPGVTNEKLPCGGLGEEPELGNKSWLTETPGHRAADVPSAPTGARDMRPGSTPAPMGQQMKQ